MNFGALFTSGSIVGLLALASGVATATGNPILGAFMSDPHTAAAATAAVTGILGLVAGVMEGVKKPPAP